MSGLRTPDVRDVRIDVHRATDAVATAGVDDAASRGGGDPCARRRAARAGAEEQHVTRAAERLRISQPPPSR